MRTRTEPFPNHGSGQNSPEVRRRTGAALKNGARFDIHQVETRLEPATTIFLTILPTISFRKAIHSGVEVGWATMNTSGRRLLTKIAALIRSETLRS